MIAIRRVVVLTLWFVALSGLPHLAGAVQAQDALEKEQSNSEKPSEPQSNTMKFYPRKNQSSATTGI